MVVDGSSMGIARSLAPGCDKTSAVDSALLQAAEAALGFMPPDEGLALHEAAARAARSFPGSPLLEIGTYCGKSAIYLGAAARAARPATVLFTVDHHRGSEENQAGWEHHDPTLVDPVTGRFDTLPTFRRTIAAAGLEDTVIGVLGDSPTVAAHWSKPLALLFIDGGHGEEVAWADYRAWTPKLSLVGSLLAIHDVFPDPDDGGRPPYELYVHALESGGFVELEELRCGSLRVLHRVLENN
jgi:predicted O-methyltransferase YrrM